MLGLFQCPNWKPPGASGRQKTDHGEDPEQASGSQASVSQGSACKRIGAGDEQAPQATFESVDADDEFGDMGRGDATCKHKRNAWRESQVVSTPI